MKKTVAIVLIAVITLGSSIKAWACYEAADCAAATAAAASLTQPAAVACATPEPAEPLACTLALGALAVATAYAAHVCANQCGSA